MFAVDHIFKQAVVCFRRCQCSPFQIGCQQIKHVVPVRFQSDFPVITVPKFMQQNLEKRKRKEEKRHAIKRLEAIRTESRKGSKEVCVVRCKDTHLNHYLGQSYPRATGVQLASRGWHHTRSRGDHFTVCARTDLDSDLAVDRSDQHHSTVSSFAELGLNANIVANLQKMDIVTPTEIQRRAIPRLLSGSDTLVAAETGCGKTVAAAAPMLHRLLAETPPAADRPRADTNRPRALIVTPGRELAVQIRDVLLAMTADLPLHVRMLLGGRTKRKMERPTVLPMDVLVASFGALSKLHSVGILDLSRVSQVILDEADTLLDDSFREDVRRLLSRLPLSALSGDLQRPGDGGGPTTALTLLAATLPRNLDSLLEGLVTGQVSRVTSARLHHLLPHVQQSFLRLGSAQRADALVRLCREATERREPVIVFSNNAPTCDWVSLHLNESGVDCLNVSGRLHYKLRQGRWAAFLAGEPAVLSCTDLVSRGLDSCRVEHVINFDFPWNTSDYIHRAGRVGRAGSERAGTVTSFVSRPLDVAIAQRIERAARTGEPLWNVDANIKDIIAKRMMRKEATTSQQQRRRRS
ncbi:putative ATP-dependent RNA helicase DDX28 [Amphibalanus amphitrite]|uniref:RNA helicase n=1 Tax=Amphibalanus amphitrite TaxID=1232801 RepID=A0A6A4X579_AMPAM|nr:putative ATP-dependent RNA helicase DDX28 [Amphibalanus amphitrite]